MQLLIDALNKLKEGVDPDHGICMNIMTAAREADKSIVDSSPIVDVFINIASHWPYHSGNLVYPIPDLTQTRSAVDYFRYHGYHDSLWEGAGGILRRDLINFCIAYLTVDGFDAKSWTNPEIEPYV